MLPLEKAVFGVPATDRNSSIVARHYGFDGGGGANFQRIGDEFGLTRERVRQIVSESDPHGHIPPGGCSALDCVIAFIAAGLPAPAAEIEAKLHLAGLTRKRFRIEGIVNVAGLLRRAVPFRIKVLNCRYLHRSEQFQSSVFLRIPEWPPTDWQWNIADVP